jgi:hypothetical protein
MQHIYIFPLSLQHFLFKIMIIKVKKTVPLSAMEALGGIGGIVPTHS